MSKNNIVEFEGQEASADPLSELLQAGAQKLVHQAVEAELYACLEQYANRRTEASHAGVVRNGYQSERKIQTGIGPVTVKIPKVRAKTGEPATFQSALVPPYVRKTQSLEAALPWLYLKGISIGEIGAKIVANAVFLDFGIIVDATTDKDREYPVSFVIPIKK